MKKVLSLGELGEIYEKEKTPCRELFEKISLEKQETIVAECEAVTKEDIRKADELANSVIGDDRNPLEWADYHESVWSNFNLESRRKIAKKYGIKMGDTFTLEMAEMKPALRAEALN